MGDSRVSWQSVKTLLSCGMRRHVQIHVFHDIMPYQLVNSYVRFKSSECLHRKGQDVLGHQHSNYTTAKQ